MKYKFDFAISFSGVDRAIAEKLEELLVARGAKVFYDASYRSNLLGKRLDKAFLQIYGSMTHFFVPIVSASYVERKWTEHEWNVAQHEAEKRDGEFILPLRVDDTFLVGLSDTIGYIDLRHVDLDEAAGYLYDKLVSVETGEVFPSSEYGVGSTEETIGYSLPEIKAQVAFESPVQDWVVTFGVAIESLEEWSLPPEAPYDYADLCDWLTGELMDRLSRTSLQKLQITEDARSGEGLSVRLSFEWNPDDGSLNFGDLGWWELLELLPYDEVYPE